MFKIYDIVVVQKEGYRHYGQVLSLPTPDQTLMIRRVPGHPGTLEELKVNTLERSNRKVKWAHYAIVKGVGSFPVDMLRYDMASPLNFTIEENWVGPKASPTDPSFGFGSDLVIVGCSDRMHPNWTSDRWRSFLWSIKEFRSEKIEQQ